MCPVGHYCEVGTGTPVLCVPGTYTNTMQNDVCLPCPAGSYCITGSNPESCPAGFYCPQGTGHGLWPCPAGTFSSSIGNGVINLLVKMSICKNENMYVCFNNIDDLLNCHDTLLS